MAKPERVYIDALRAELARAQQAPPIDYFPLFVRDHNRKKDLIAQIAIAEAAAAKKAVAAMKVRK
jgi:hypothetical protein